jgi:ATP-dependent Clp protease ATP-binding subunit ClpA
MYERFTDRARKVMQLANQEAQRFNHEYIGTEHILLGLVKEGSGVAANVLKNLDIDLRKIRLEVEKVVQPGPDVTWGRPPQTPRAKKVIERAIEECQNLHHNYVGTEHLLLGLLREQEGVAAQVLLNLGLKLEDVREEVLNLLGHGGPAREAAPRRKTGLERLARQAGLSLRRRANLTIFISGVVATLAAGCVGLSYAEGDTVHAAALLGGIVYVGAVALACWSCSRQPDSKP